jgi:hypothetical protein
LTSNCCVRPARRLPGPLNDLEGALEEAGRPSGNVTSLTGTR